MKEFFTEAKEQYRKGRDRANQGAWFGLLVWIWLWTYLLICHLLGSH